MKAIESLDNPLIKTLLKLHKRKYRDLYQQFLVEGFHLVMEALKQNKLFMILTTKELADQFNDFSNVIIVPEKIIHKLSTTTSPQGVIGVCNFNEIKEEQNFDLVVLLDQIKDPSNLGAIIRSCVAFGVQTLYLSNDSVDIYNDKVIRASQGAIFYLNIVNTNLELVISQLKVDGFKLYGTLFKVAKTSLNNLKFNDKVALLLGNEAHGISSSLWNLIDENFCIPISTNIESLNVAHSLSISLYEFFKQFPNKKAN